MARATGGTGDALVLNATYEPLCVVSQRRAIVLVLTAKAVVVEGGEGALRSPTRRVDIPAVVRLARFVRVPVPGRRAPDPEGGARPRRAPMCLLRRSRHLPRPRRPAQPRRTALLGQRRRRLRPVQPHQGRPQRRGHGLAAALRSRGRRAGPPGGCSGPGGSTRGGRPTSTGTCRRPPPPDAS